MSTIERDKLKHDFLNSIVIINSMTKSASNFLNQLPKHIDGNGIKEEQMKKFLSSMKIIREQTAKIENYFQILLKE
jgi:hypothetical protein